MQTLTKIAAVLVALALGFGRVALASAQTTAVMLFLAPHCSQADRTLCPQFTVRDAQHLTTPELSPGDLLDLDVVLRGNLKSIRTVKSWLKYDPAVLEARSVELLSPLPAPYPGEQSIDSAAGIVKIGGATNGGIDGSDVPVARVTFRVLSASADSVISFHGFTNNGFGQTAVNAAGAPEGNEPGTLPTPPCVDALFGCKDGILPLLTIEPSKLFVDMKSSQTIPPAPTGTVSSAMSPLPFPASSPLPQQPTPQTPVQGTLGSSFPVLQVQNVVATTKGGEIFVGWSPLRSTELAGYNVYYGTVSGRYIQRHSAPGDATSHTIRDLEPGTTYYISVRAFNAANFESAFSQEVSVTVGKPETAVNPLVYDDAARAATKSSTKVAGDTGTANTIALLLLCSALIGTGFAFRRQLLVSANG